MRRIFVLSMLMLYSVGIVIQFLYVPYIARVGPQLHFAPYEANYSWRWNAPMYFDIEKMENIFLSQVEERKNNRFLKYPSNRQRTLDSVMYETKNPLLQDEAIPLPDSWLKIYGIDYKRVLMTFVAWTLLIGVLWFAGKHFFKTE